jgi:peptide/nickel transport system permease protein
MQRMSPVLSLVATRLGLSALTLLIVSLVVFAATELLPGDVAEAVLGQSATPDAVAALRSVMHLDEPAWWRYLTWLAGLLHGDLGRSLVNNMPVVQLIGGRLPNSLLLAGITAAFCVPVALSLGMTAAIFHDTLYDRIVGLLTISAVSVPEFLVATLAVLVFAVTLHWLPALSYGVVIHSPAQFFRVFAMPVLTLSFAIIAHMARMTRAALTNVLSSSYIEMAVLKGARRGRIVLRHALPNALGPIVNAVALSLSFLLGGVIIVETIFNYPGLAKLMVDAVATRDMPLVQACAMIFCTAYLLLVMIADTCAILSNPRLRHR